MSNRSEKAAGLYEVIRQVRPVHRRLARAVEAKLAELEISVGMRAVMEVLSEEGPMSVPEIGRTLFLSRQQIQLMVNELEQSGLVERKINPAHKRSALFLLAANGQSAFEKIRGKEDRDLEKIAENFSQDELRAAKKVLGAMLDYFSDYEDDPDHPKGLG